MRVDDGRPRPARRRRGAGRSLRDCGATFGGPAGPGPSSSTSCGHPRRSTVGGVPDAAWCDDPVGGRRVRGAGRRPSWPRGCTDAAHGMAGVAGAAGRPAIGPPPQPPASARPPSRPRRAGCCVASAPRDTARPRARRTCPARAGPRGPKPSSPGRPGDRAAVTDGGGACPPGIVVDPRPTGASAAHAVRRRPRPRADAPRDGRPAIRELARRARPAGRSDHGARLLGRRPAPGSSPHRQAGVTETRRGGGSGAPGIPPPPSRGARAPRHASCVFAGGGVAGGGPRRRPARRAARRAGGYR